MFITRAEKNIIKQHKIHAAIKIKSIKRFQWKKKQKRGT